MNISDLKAELERMHGASFGWALSCCQRDRAQAEEVLQTVYVKVLEGKAIYRGESQFRTWLFAVIRKTAITEERKRLFRSLIPGSSAQSQTLHSSLNVEPEAEVERSEMQQRFKQAMQVLPSRQRETLHLVFYQDLTLREAAQVMGISIGSVRRHYERGKKRLREALEGEESNYEIGWRGKENSGVVL